MTPSLNEHPATTHTLPDCLSKLMKVCIASSSSLRHDVKLTEIHARDQVRLTIPALELLRQAHAAAGKLLVDVADLYQLFSDAVLPKEQPAQQATAELQPTTDKQPSVNWFPLCPLLACPHCGAIVLALDSSPPAGRLRMARELTRVLKTCTRSLLRPRLRQNVVASLRAIEVNKLAPETLRELHWIYRWVGELVVDVHKWFQPMQDLLAAAASLDDNQEELPAFVLSVAGFVDVQRREPCDHLVEFSCMWSKNARICGMDHPVGWRRPVDPDVACYAVEQLQTQRFSIDGTVKDAYPPRFGASGKAVFAAEAPSPHR